MSKPSNKRIETKKGDELRNLIEQIKGKGNKNPEETLRDIVEVLGKYGLLYEFVTSMIDQARKKALLNGFFVGIGLGCIIIAVVIIIWR